MSVRSIGGSKSLGERAASVRGIAEVGLTNPRVPLIALMKELPGDSTYLCTTVRSKFRLFSEQQRQ